MNDPISCGDENLVGEEEEDSRHLAQGSALSYKVDHVEGKVLVVLEGVNE